MKLPSTHPVLVSQRLVLRPFRLADAPTVQRLAGTREIAETTLLVPHPYADGMAEQWIGMQPRLFQAGKLVDFAMVLRQSEELCGSIGLSLQTSDDRAELGYWVGLPFWGKGYCTEATREIVRWAFDVLRVRRICAHHFTRNIASCRVLSKVGFRHEGTFREHVRKWNQFEDIDFYGVLRKDWKG